MLRMQAKLYLTESAFQSIRSDITLLARNLRVTRSKGNLKEFVEALAAYFVNQKLNQEEYWQDVSTRKR
jgi:hypothetical protein